MRTTRTALAVAAVTTVSAALSPTLPATGAAAPHPVTVQRHAPRGLDPAVPWLDRHRNVIHDGARRIRLGFPGYVQDFRQAGHGFVVHVLRNGLNQERLYAVGHGRPVLLTTRLSGDYQVSVDPHGQVAYQAYAPGTHRSYRLYVQRLSDGHVVAHRAVTWRGEPLAFRRHRVWRNANGSLAVWNLRRGTLVGTGRPTAVAVDLVHGYAAHWHGSRTIYFPLRAGATWRSWSTGTPGVFGWSPDGRLVATYTYGGEDDYAGRVVLRRARTGAEVRTFVPARFSTFYLSTARWEGPRQLLVPADATFAGTDQRVNLVRLRAGGTYAAASRTGGDTASPVIPAWPANGPSS